MFQHEDTCAKSALRKNNYSPIFNEYDYIIIF